MRRMIAAIVFALFVILTGMYMQPGREKSVSVNPMISISTCANLNVAGTTYYLTADIINSSTSYCMNISANNIVLDCQGHLIQGNTTSVYGVYISRSLETSTNITITNCTVANWDVANIYVYKSTNNTIDNVKSNESQNYGIYIYTANGNNITNCRVRDNSHNGIYIKYGDNTYIADTVSSGQSTRSGIRVYDSDFVVLKNTTADSNLVGISIYRSNNCTIIDSSASSNSDTGFSIYYNADENNFTNCQTELNIFGFYVRYADRNRISNCTSISDTYGIWILEASECNYIIDSTIKSSVTGGILISSSSNNVIYNNLFNSTTNAYTDGWGNYWNTTIQIGDRIFENGTQISGNYWDNSTGGYSVTCTDSDIDGFCDIPFKIDANNFDYMPLSDEYSATYISLLSPTDNSTWVESSTVNFTYNILSRDNITSCTLYIKNDTLNASYIHDRGNFTQLPVNCNNVFTSKNDTHIFGICGSDDGAISNYTFLHNIDTNETKRLAEKPFRVDTEACAWNGSIFACAGGNTLSGYTNRTYRVDPYTNTTTENTDENLPIPMYNSKACSNGTHVWIMAGQNESSIYESNIYRWDLEAQTIVDTGNDVYDTGYVQATVVDMGPDDERCFVIGGKHYAVMNYILLFNKTTETTSIHATMPLGLYGAVGLNVDDHVYYGGGSSASGVWNYNWYKFPANETSVTYTLIGNTTYPRATAGAEWLNDSGRGLLLGGSYGPTDYSVTSDITRIQFYNYLTNITQYPTTNITSNFTRELANTTDYYWSVDCINSIGTIYQLDEWNVSLALAPTAAYRPILIIVRR